MDNMIYTKEVILNLKRVKAEKNLSLDKIVSLMEQNDEYVSKTTLSRVFAAGSEDKLFRYETTLRPIANALLDIENIETDDDLDTQAYKSLLKLKKEIIEENARQIEALKEEIGKEKARYHEKLAKETDQFQKSLAFATHQIELKDKRIDQLMASNIKLLDQLLACPCRKNDKIGMTDE